MRRFLILLLLAMLAPHSPRADALAPVGAGSFSLESLFRSPPPRPPGPVLAPAAPGAICRAALAAAELRHGIPRGLLQAVGLVESGRPDASGARQPWPWTVDAEGEPHFFASKAQAVAWVGRAQAAGMRSIDVGCAQVNLLHHPDAFASLEQAFDPVANADYAARFLRQLHDGAAGGNWMTAAGLYHSQTPDLADAYRRRIAAAGGAAGLAAAAPVRTPFGLERPMPPVARRRGAQVLAAPPGATGRGLAAYRAAPIRAARAVAPLEAGR